MKNGMILWAVSGIAAAGLAVACSSSSGGSSPPPDAGTPEDTGTTHRQREQQRQQQRQRRLVDAGMCTGTSDCTTAGQVCCGTSHGERCPEPRCQAGPCTALPVVGALQLCTAASDCTAPQACDPNATVDAVEPGQKACAPPRRATAVRPVTAAPTPLREHGDAGGDAADGG